MASWAEFEAAEPEMAANGKRMLMLGLEYGSFVSGLGYLGTIRPDGGPRIHPVAPVLVNGHLYVIVLKGTAKAGDLRGDDRYALHAFPHAMGEESFDDEEFYLSGRAIRVTDEAVAREVVEACGYSEDAGTAWELGVERVMWKRRVEGGAVYGRWRAT